MNKYDYYYTSKPKTITNYAVLGLLSIFCLTIATFALLQIKNFYNDEAAVKSMLMNSFKSSKTQESPVNTNNKHEKVNSQEPENNEKLLQHIISQPLLNSERQARAANSENTNSSQQKSNSYYEEQRPVVVYSKTDTDPSIALRQMAEVPPKQDNDEEDPYSKSLAEDYYENSDDNDYFGQTEQKRTQQEPQSYYRQRPYNRQLQSSPPPYYYGQQQALQPYYRQQPAQLPYYQSPTIAPYYDDSREEMRGSANEQQTSEEARGSSQYQDYDNYYRQHPYVTASPKPAAGKETGIRLTGTGVENRKMPTAASSKAAQQPNRDPYHAYMDDYDYMTPQSHSHPPPQRPYARRPGPPQLPQYRTPSTSSPPKQTQETGQQMDFLTMFKSLKTMWDLYHSFTSSWNTIAERRNREEAIAQQKYKQPQQIRINSKKPPKFNNKKNNNTQTTKNPRKQTTTTTATVQPALKSLEDNTSSEEQVLPVKKQPVAKNEPRKGTKADKGYSRDVEGMRDKRQADDKKESTDVAEGRYIKGDPLKGYYDFVITEGSYKFWAVFQVGTAILIIYSTFAAIYYSKVNPLVSDYDYTDYLGGARSLSGGDLDFVDDDVGVVEKAQPKSWLEYLPRSGHSLKFILDAIDKLPTDHDTEKTNGEAFKEDRSTEVKDNLEEIEYTDELEPANESESTQETNNSKEAKQDNAAM